MKRFFVQKKSGAQFHYDFGIEWNGVFKSWALPDGPSLDPSDARVAFHIEDQPLENANYEGTIPAGYYGVGTAIAWDQGYWLPIGDAARGYAEGKLRIELRGVKLRGAWCLKRTASSDTRRERWLLIKADDDAATPSAVCNIVEARPESVLNSGLTN